MVTNGSCLCFRNKEIIFLICYLIETSKIPYHQYHIRMVKIDSGPSGRLELTVLLYPIS